MKTAIFSNGHQDTYKGKRDIKAAWMITRKEDGEVLASGHSLDAQKARKTAEGNVRYVVSEEGRPVFSVARGRLQVQQHAYYKKLAEDYGFEGRGDYMKFLRDMVAENIVRRQRLVNIEIIEL